MLCCAQHDNVALVTLSGAKASLVGAGMLHCAQHDKVTLYDKFGHPLTGAPERGAGDNSFSVQPQREVRAHCSRVAAGSGREK